MWYALFDFEHSKSKLLSSPKLYDIGLMNKCFSVRIFWKWVISGSIQALALVIFTFVVFEGMSSSNSSGSYSSLWLSGTITYAGVVILANF